MKIKIWGSRGSLPTPGMKTIKYGGNTTCIELRSNDNTIIIIDAGSGIRKLGKELINDRDGSEIFLYLTHPHWDHIMGFPFFYPAYEDKFKIHIRGGPHAKRSLRSYLKHQMEAPYFPVRFQSMKAAFDFTKGIPQVRRLNTLEIIPISLSHPNGCYGYKFIEDGKSFIFFTDHELDFQHQGGLDIKEYIDFCNGADLLLHDSQYTDEEYQYTRGWGHSTFYSATDFCIKSGVKRFGIFHHDPDHDDGQVEEYESLCKKRIKAADCKIDCFAVEEGMELYL